MYLHDPRLMRKDAKTKSRKKNNEDLVVDSLFWYGGYYYYDRAFNVNILIIFAVLAFLTISVYYIII